VVAFDRSMSEQAERSVLLENALRRGLEKNGFALEYQPQFNAQGDLRGFEALLRLNDEVLGAIDPDEFIPVAETLGLIVRIGEWVLREVCGQWTEWAEDGNPRVSMAVNISSVQLKSGEFPAFVRNVLAQTGMPAELLELELTETGIFAHADQGLSELKAIGVRIAVDDFGTGFSSLSSLYGFPVDYVKIDRSFVRDAASTPGTLPFIRMIVSLARSLGMKTVADGVETPDQMEAVKRAGCDILQGYWLSHPLTAEKAFLLLQVRASDRWETLEAESPTGASVL
jgi:EAL domain-containing protein (putative c-di-GMP-specific phosphodiesterase class I)